MTSVLWPGLLLQDGVCLARGHDLHQHVQRATVHADGDRQCRGLPRVALQLSLFDAATDPPEVGRWCLLVTTSPTDTMRKLKVVEDVPQGSTFRSLLQERRK